MADGPHVYNPQTGIWEVPSSSQSSAKEYGPHVYNQETGIWEIQPVDTKPLEKPQQGGGGGGGSSSQVDTQSQADKEFIDNESNTLTGDLTLTSTSKSIKIQVNDTVMLKGLGKYLSGLYLVTGVKRSLNQSGGYSHSFTLSRNGFGETLKSASPQQTEPQKEEEPRKEEVPKDAPTYGVGDTVKIIGDDAVYSNAHDGVKVPAWVKQKSLTIAEVSEDGTRVRLDPIFSWTYTKYIQKN